MPSIIRNKKFIISFFAILFLIIGVFCYHSFKSNSQDASAAGEGWLSGYSRRKAVTITNSNTGTAGTINGNPVLGATGKFGTAISMDGSGDYVSFADSNNFDFETESFTVDWWVKYNVNNKYQTIFSHGYSSANGIVAQTQSSSATLLIYLSGSVVITESSAPSLNTWYHYALVRNGTSLVLYRNGVSVGSATSSVNLTSTATFDLGNNPSDSSLGINGYIDEFRVSKGIARWTSNFTPSTAAYSNDQYTKLLLHLDETSGTTVYSDPTLTDYQVKLTVPYDSDMQADFDDLRFTSSDGSTSLNYWLESKTDSSTAIVWVKVPSLTSGDNTIYMYYGNSGAASGSSGNNTFVFFDDFNAGSSPDTSKWFISGSYSLSNGELVMTGTGNYTPAMIAKSGGSYLELGSDYSIMSRFKHVTYSNASVNCPAGFTAESITDSYFWYPGASAALYFDDRFNIYIARGPGENYYNSTVASTSVNNVYYKYELKRRSNTVEIYMDDVQLANSGSAAPSGNLRPFIESHVATSRGYMDWYAVRKIVTTEPAVTIGSEESLSVDGSCVSSASVSCSQSVDGSYIINTYTLSGSSAGSTAWIPPAGVSSAEYLVVGGGGAGGGSDTSTNAPGGGGGAGGFRTGTMTVSSSSQMSVFVGAGGAAVNSGSGGNYGNSGGNSSFGLSSGGSEGTTLITSNGGGGGGKAALSGLSGGSGGGAPGKATTGGAAIVTSPVQGYKGGDTTYGSYQASSGGGGAGGAGGNGIGGANASVGRPGDGGAGSTSSITGSSLPYAAGGGGGSEGTDVSQGLGGSAGGTRIGGNGGVNYGSTRVATAGAANTGSGGGGAVGAVGVYSGAGGSGVVVIRYLDPAAGDCVSTSSVTCTQTTDGNYVINKYTLSGSATGSTTWTPPEGVSSVQYLVVAGGGGGTGGAGGGGGGAGGLLEGTTSVASVTSIGVTVGRGGNGGGLTPSPPSTSGENSSLVVDSTTITAVGGGYGAYYYMGGGYAAASGGSGGGSSQGESNGLGTSGQGYAGGNGNFSYSGSGGGGAGGVGGNASSVGGGAGGVGLVSSITGSPIYYAGGGGGGGHMSGMTGGDGGVGGGGSGSQYTGNSGTSGTNGLGGGGGGGGGQNGIVNAPGGNGGSGVVVIRYLDPNAGDCVSTSSVTCTQTTNGSYIINTYTLSGSSTGTATWIPPEGVSSVQYLVVAGGGGGGGSNAGGAGGGGAGGLLTSTLSVSGSSNITVGAGGLAGTSGGGAGGDGSNSIFVNGSNTITAYGGGGGGGNPAMAGRTGGSGGGAYYNGAKGESYSNDAQGHDGGIGDTTYYATGGGGGGAGSSGGGGTSSSGGAGGDGFLSDITSNVYAAGGGGGVQVSSLSGGAGGSSGIGGAGNNNGAGSAGTANTGSGGGGAGGGTYAGGGGGSGVVIIRYSTSTPPTVTNLYVPSED